MAKRHQTFLTVCFLFVMLISGLQNDGAFYTLPLSVDLPNAIVAADSSISETNAGYTRLNKQEYWSTGNVARLSSSFLKKSQNRTKSSEKNEVTFVVLNVSFKVILFSIIMILFAAGGAGLSMPFRCLLYYIHNIDGKKRYC